MRTNAEGQPRRSARRRHRVPAARVGAGRAARRASTRVGACIYEDLPPADARGARPDAPRRGEGEGRSRETFDRLREFAAQFMPGLAEKIEHYSGARPIFDLYGVEDEIQHALEKEVPLKSGGYLVIDQTEAMTTIDVNTGSFLGQRNLEETVFRTNLEAAQAVARQLRLRNLGGIIIIDFIDMQDAEHRRQVLRTLEKALARDHAKTTVYDFSPLGLVEMTRKRTVESLERQLCEPCHECGGRGMLKTCRDGDLRDLPRDHPRRAPVRGGAPAGDRVAQGRGAHHRRRVGGGRRTRGIPRQDRSASRRTSSTCRSSSMSCCSDPSRSGRCRRPCAGGCATRDAMLWIRRAGAARARGADGRASPSQLLPLAERHPDTHRGVAERTRGPAGAFRRAWKRSGRGAARCCGSTTCASATGAVGRPGRRHRNAGSLYAGLLPGRTFTELRLRGLDLTVQRDGDGQWIGARPAGPAAEAEGDPFAALERLGELQVIGGRLHVVAPSLRHRRAPAAHRPAPARGGRSRAQRDARVDAGGRDRRRWMPRSISTASAAMAARYAGAPKADLAAWSPLLHVAGVQVDGGRGRARLGQRCATIASPTSRSTRRSTP